MLSGVNTPDIDALNESQFLLNRWYSKA